jgi:hypothetical protein
LTNTQNIAPKHPMHITKSSYCYIFVNQKLLTYQIFSRDSFFLCFFFK